MKFFVQNYSCLQNPRVRGYRPQIPVPSLLSPQLNLLNPPEKKILGTPLTYIDDARSNTNQIYSTRDISSTVHIYKHKQYTERHKTNNT